MSFCAQEEGSARPRPLLPSQPEDLLIMNPRRPPSRRAAVSPDQRNLHQAQALETLQALQALEELREAVGRVMSLLSPDEDPVFAEELARRVGDLGSRLPALQDHLSDRLHSLLWLTAPVLRKEVKSLVPKNHRESLTEFLKQSSSALPGADPTPRFLNNADAGLFYFNTTNSGGSTPQQRREDEPEEGSLYDVPTAPKLPKTSPGGEPVDTRNWDWALMYPNTRIPKVVRR